VYKENPPKPFVNVQSGELNEYRTGYRVDRSGSIPGRSKIFLFSTACKTTVGPTHPPIQRVPEALSPEVKRQERETDHIPPCSAEVKKDGAKPPLRNMSLWYSA
jgi:hypothetical protein